MRKTTKKLFTFLCSIAATACVGAGGAYAYSQTARAQAEVATAAELVDFTVDGVGNTHNHFFYTDGGFYQLTLDFNQGGLAFNAHAAAVSGITFNGVPMTCGGAPSDDSIMVITLGSGLWVHYTAQQATSGYKGYTHPTIHFEEGATVTDVNGVTMTYAELTLYLTNGAWTTEKPSNYGTQGEVNYAPGFISIGEVNHVYSEGLDAYGVSLRYATTGFEEENTQHTVLNFSGFSLNGEEIGVALWGKDQVLLWLAARKCVNGYNGYSHPTLAIAEGAKVINTAGEEFTLGAVTLYLVNGAWTTVKPEGYFVEKAKASFVDFNVDGVGGIRNHFDNGNFYEVSIDFDQSGLAFNAHATSVSGLTFNGVPMICGGAPSGDEIMVITLNSGLWIHYTAEQAATGYKGYSHATIHFADGAVVTDINGESLNYAELTLYLVDGAWTTEMPEDYYVEKPKAAFVDFNVDGVGGIRNHFDSGSHFEVSLDFDQAGLAFNKHAAAVAGMTFNGVPMTCGGAPSGDAIMVITLNSRLWIHYTAEQAAAGYKGYSHATICFEDGAAVTDENGEVLTYEALTLYLVNGAWTTEMPEDYEIKEAEPLPDPLLYNGIAYGWNNTIYSGVSNTILQFGEYGVDFLGPDNGTESHANPTNLANPANKAPIATALTINGTPIGELYEKDHSVEVAYTHGYNYFYIAIPEYMLAKDGYGCVTLHIEEKTVFLDCVLPEVTLYFYEGAWTSTKPDTIDGEDTEYTTVGGLFGETTKVLSGNENAESEIAVNDSVIYNFLFKNDGANNTVIFSTHYTTDFDGIKVVFMGDEATQSERILLFVNGQEIAGSSYLWTESEWFAVRVAVSIEETLSVSVAIDGVFFIKAADLSKDALGSKVGFKNEKGTNTIADYKAGDIKKPVLHWQGKEVYNFEVNEEKPADSVFQGAIDIMDNKDGGIAESALQVLWQEGAVTDGKLNEGVWKVILSVSDSAENISQYTITVVVEDKNKAIVTFDGVATDTIYHIGDLLTEPETPVKEGYTFEGWYDGDRKWDFVNDVVKGDLALVAKFSKVETAYIITLTSEGLDENYLYTFELAQGAVLDQSILVREGYIYTLYEGESEVQTIVVEGDAQYRVVYEKVEDDEPIIKPDDDTGSTGTNDGTSAKGDEGGCSGVVSLGGAGLAVLFGAVVAMRKKKED